MKKAVENEIYLVKLEMCLHMTQEMKNKSDVIKEEENK